MYNYIFYFFYSVYKRRKDGGERLSGVVFTWAAQLVHLVFLFGIVKSIFSKNTKGIFPHNKFVDFIFHDRFYMQFTIALPWIVILYFYYNQKRIDKIERKYSNTEIINLKNGLIILLLLIVPILIGIVMQ